MAGCATNQLSDSGKGDCPHHTREEPDIVALQEVGRWSSLARCPLGDAPGEETTEFDFLEYLEYKAHTFYAQGEIVTLLSSEKCRVKKTGKVLDNQLASIVRVKNGKIVHYLEYADTTAMQAAFESNQP